MKIGLILGDQLTLTLASLRVLDPTQDRLIMAEVMEEATYVPHHPQKIALIFSAMRHFCAELRQQGWQVNYYSFDPERHEQSLIAILEKSVEDLSPEALIMTQCGEYRLQHQMDLQWRKTLGVPVEIYGDDRFICTTSEFADWADGRKQLRMEYFYREMRRKTGYLMTKEGKPEGDQWNFDADNRKRWKGDPPLPPPPEFERDQIDKDVLTLVHTHFSEHLPEHPNSLENFHWATTREQAIQALRYFVKHGLPYFGDYQDAMVKDESRLFHSLLSPYINCGLLTAKEVCDDVEKAYKTGHIPLNAAEGFIRQVIGWREYVRGIYWLKMPSYAKANNLNHTRELPSYFWTGKTRMACMADSFKNTFNNAYAHHIQRLMITGNFSLIAGLAPEAVCEWYLAVYADAYEWVELPNTLGMVLHADEGYLGSKPYAASGNYINKMSDYCKGCEYQVKTATDEDSCPFNSLYWNFIHRHKDTFAKNQRMSMIYRNFERMDSNKRDAIIARSNHLLEHLNEL